MTHAINEMLVKRAERAERRLAETVKVADMIEAMCDDEIATLKKRIDELELELYWLNESEIDENHDATINEAIRLQDLDRAERDDAMYGPTPY